MDNKTTNTVSKFLSLVLRHKPELIGIELDTQGWVDVDILIKQLNANGASVDRELLDYVVETNSKKRFAFNENRERIRASQGHSIPVEMGYVAQNPPDVLFHGTGEKSVASILNTGLEKRDRQYVHLSQDLQTATQVGSRHGKPVVFTILAGEMQAAGYLFYLSENNVWLTDKVPVEFVRI